MCGRYVAPDQAALERAFHLGRHNWRGVIARYNVAPSAIVPMIYAPGGAPPEGELARWGLIPDWWKKDQPPTLSFNARSEEAAGKPMWRGALRHARCLLPALGWYEWNEQEQVLNPAGRKVNRPYFIRCPDEPVVAIAGLWSTWRKPDGGQILSCALLTKAAAPSIGGIHHRMPVVLKPAQHEAWLAPQSSPEEVAQLVAGAREDLAGYAVNVGVNNTRNDSPELLQPQA